MRRSSSPTRRSREPRRFGVDFAITATFVAIVALGIRRCSDAVVALAAALIASALATYIVRAFAFTVALPSVPPRRVARYLDALPAAA